MITTNVPVLQIHKLTEEQYEAARIAGQLNENAIYMTPEEDTNIDFSELVHLAGSETITGDKTFAGQVILTKNVGYGEQLPTTGKNGQIFFKKKTEEENENEQPQYDFLPITGGVIDGNINVRDVTAENITTGNIITESITSNNFVGSLTGTSDNAQKIYVNNTTENDKYYVVGSKTTGNSQLYRALNTAGTSNTVGVYFNGATGVLFGAAWNDYAEYRRTEENIQAGNVVVETGKGDLVLSSERLQPGAEIISDTFGFAIGETDVCKTPIAVSGRVLAYTNEDRNSYKPGDAVCSGPCGTVSKMTREEIKEYPDRIIGTVSEIPDYDTWGYNNVQVRERIWIRIR